MLFKRLKKSTPEQEEEFSRQIQEAKPDKGDIWIMILTAFFTLVVPAALFLIAIVLLCLWIFGISIF